MKIKSNASLSPISENPKSIAGITNKILENIQSQINDVNTRTTQNTTDIENLGTQVNTGDVNASGSVSSVSGSFDKINVNGVASIDTISAGSSNIRTETVNELNVNNENVTNLTATKIDTDTVNAGTVNAENLNVNALTIDAANIVKVTSEEVAANVVNSKTVNTNEIQTENLTSTGNITGENIDSNTASINDLNVSKKVYTINLGAENADIKNAKIKTSETVSITHDNNTDSFLVIDSDVYIKIPKNIASNVILKLKNGSDAIILSASISTNEITNGEPVITILYNNENSLESIFIDEDGNVWFKLKAGITGSLYYFITGMSNNIPETYAQENTPFDISTAKEYSVATKKTGTLVYDNTGFTVDAPDINVNGDTVFNGNVYIKGTTTIEGMASERSKYLGNSNNVTADNNGVLSANGASIDGNISVTGDITETSLTSKEPITSDNVIGYDETGRHIPITVPNILKSYDAVVSSLDELIAALNDFKVVTIAVNFNISNFTSETAVNIYTRKELYAIGTKRISANMGYIKGENITFHDFNSVAILGNCFRNVTFDNCWILGYYEYINSSDAPLFNSCTIELSNMELDNNNGRGISNINNSKINLIITGSTRGGYFTALSYVKNCKISIITDISNATTTVQLSNIYNSEIKINNSSNSEYSLPFEIDGANNEINMTCSKKLAGNFAHLRLSSISGSYISVMVSHPYADFPALELFDKVVNNTISIYKASTEQLASHTRKCAISFSSSISDYYNVAMDNNIEVFGSFISSNIDKASVFSVGAGSTDVLKGAMKNNVIQFLMECKIPLLIDSQKIYNFIGNTFKNKNTLLDTTAFYADEGVNTISNTATGGFNRNLV